MALTLGNCLGAYDLVAAIGAGEMGEARTKSHGHQMARSCFYVPRLGEFEAVTITTQPTFAFGNAVTVPRPFAPGPPNVRTLYGVAPSGKFVGLIPFGATEPHPRQNAQIQVVLNWFDELRMGVPPAE